MGLSMELRLALNPWQSVSLSLCCRREPLLKRPLYIQPPCQTQHCSDEVERLYTQVLFLQPWLLKYLLIWISWFGLVYLFFFWDKFSLSSPGWPGTHLVFQSSLKFIEICMLQFPAFTSTPCLIMMCLHLWVNSVPLCPTSSCPSRSCSFWEVWLIVILLRYHS